MSQARENERWARRAAGPDAGWAAMLAGLQADFAVHTAEAFAAGHRCLRVIHGDPQDDEEFNQLRRLNDALEDLPALLGGHPSQLVSVVRTTDATVWWWASTDTLPAQTLVAQAERIVGMYACSSWRTSQDPM